jgi:hypothetical protein
MVLGVTFEGGKIVAIDAIAAPVGSTWRSSTTERPIDPTRGASMSFTSRTSMRAATS